jgi:hypothetical protein
LPVDRIEAAQEHDEVAAELGGAGIDDQLMSGAVESADRRPLAGLPPPESIRLRRRKRVLVAGA